MTYLVANYNNGRYFKDLLASLEAQTDPNWRCLICDDASTDDSFSLIKAHIESSPVRDRIRLFRNDHNLGYGGTLKKLLTHVETDIVQFCDPDDALLPETTEAVLQAYRQHPGIAFLHAKLIAMDAAMQRPTETMGTRVPIHCTSIQKGFICLPWSFRLRLYHRTEGLDPSMRYCEDRDLYYKLEEVAHPFFIDRVLYRYRMLPHSQSHDPVKKKTGRLNDIRARQNAFRRRHIRGFRFHYASLILWLTYFLDQYPAWLVWPLFPVKGVLMGLDRIFRIRIVGTLRRPAVPEWAAG
jgi:glycosyltransferase involved in cell wall biosynthesis